MREKERRFWTKVNKTDGCWLWTGGLNWDGYGISYQNGLRLVAHRVAWVFVRGPIPKGMVLDHLCRVKACVNPDHLSVVTQRENLLRGHGITARNAKKDNCKNGHPLSGENLWINRGCRRCRECTLISNRKGQRRARA